MNVLADVSACLAAGGRSKSIRSKEGAPSNGFKGSNITDELRAVFKTKKVSHTKSFAGTRSPVVPIKRLNIVILFIC